MMGCLRHEPFRSARGLLGRLGVILVLILLLLPGIAGGEILELGGWDRAGIERLQQQAARLEAPGEQVALLSAALLGTPYRAGTLVGGADHPEEFVVRFDCVDCFTLLDLVEALRRSTDFDGFHEALRQLRYREGVVDFLRRRHFFSDWGAARPDLLREVTAQVGGAASRRETKQLNRKADGSAYLPGYPVITRELTFIPPGATDAAALARLQTGDYLGIYSPQPGLDVSHCGIAIVRDGRTFLRHASSQQAGAVVDEDLAAYLGGTRGLVVYRPLALP